MAAERGPVSPGSAGAASLLVPLVLLWLCGAALRLTILAVPPVLPVIRTELGLNATAVGVLGSVGPALFACAAVGGALLVARIGVRGALVAGLAIVAAGSALRGLTAGFASLLAASVVMAAGVAVLQPILPTAVRLWLPRAAIGLGTATYVNGLLVGEVFPVMLTLPVVLPLLHGSWRGALAVWAVPVALTAWLVHVRAPRIADAASATRSGASLWVPDWRSGLVWRLGALFASVTAVYFGTNAFVPIYLASQGRPDLVGGTLTALNLGQIPASVLLLVVARRLERRAWPYIAAALVSLLAFGGLAFFVGRATYAWAALLGFADASALILGLTLPALLCAPADVARTSAAVFTLAYGAAVGVAVLAGALWDVTGIAGVVFLPFALCAMLLALTTLALVRHRELR